MQRRERRGVELVDRLACQGALLDGGVDLGRGQPGREHVPRDLRKLKGCSRVVALVRDGDKVGAETEREQHLGRGGDEADDSHQSCL